jgi:putative oxidoreductase
MASTVRNAQWGHTEERTSGMKGIVRRIVATHGDWGATAARVALGVAMFPHGAQKLLGWFGGYGFTGTMGAFTGQMGFPAPLAAAVILIEFFAAVALILGVLGRPAALGIAAIMVGAVATVHFRNGFFMNWFGTGTGEGYEYHLLALALAAVVLLRGSGAASVDRALADTLAD